MNRPAILVASAAIAGVGAALTGGGDVFGRALSALGLPALAAPLMASPGAALYQSGRFEAAAAAFRGDGARFNEGVAAARAGDYSAALAAFDAAIAEDPNDGEARSNYDLITQLYAGVRFDDPGALIIEEREGPTLAAETGLGGARAMSTGSQATNTASGFLAPELRSDGVRRIDKVFDAQHVGATGRWLANLADEPGLFLKARLAARQAARQAAGTALPPAEDPR